MLREAVSFTDFDSFLASGSPTKTFPEVAAGDPVQIQYTSGTTGFPKGALLHHRGLTNNARMTLGRFDFAPGEAYVNPFPLFHTAGCGLGALGCVSHRLAHVPVLAFEPGLVLDLIESERAAALAGVPTVLIAVTEDPGFDTRDLSSVRAALSGGALVAPELVKRIEDRLGVRFSIIYGQTESSPVITQGRLDDSFDDRATTIGRPLPQTEVRIIDPDTRDALRPRRRRRGAVHARLPGFRLLYFVSYLPKAQAEDHRTSSYGLYWIQNQNDPSLRWIKHFDQNNHSSFVFVCVQIGEEKKEVKIRRR